MQNYKKYAIRSAQLIIADVPYSVGNNFYDSNQMRYKGGDNKNGESKLAGKAAFNSAFNFNLYEYFHFCSKMLKKDDTRPVPRGRCSDSPCMIVFCLFEQIPTLIKAAEKHGFIQTDDGRIKGKISTYGRALQVSREAFRKYLLGKDKSWKYEGLAEAMRDIVSEDECNDTYDRVRMYQALQLKAPEGVRIPSENTVRNVMAEIGFIHAKRRKPNGITKADRAARKSDDLLRRDFTADEPLAKSVTDITEIKALNGKLYVSAIFDCFDLTVLLP